MLLFSNVSFFLAHNFGIKNATFLMDASIFSVRVEEEEEEDEEMAERNIFVHCKG